MAKKAESRSVGRPTLRFVDCKIGDENYRMAFSYRKLIEAESKTGLNLLASGINAFPYISATHYRALVWAAMSIDRPSLTLEQVEDLLDFDTMPVIQKALADSYQKSTENPTEAPPAAES